MNKKLITNIRVIKMFYFSFALVAGWGEILLKLVASHLFRLIIFFYLNSPNVLRTYLIWGERENNILPLACWDFSIGRMCEKVGNLPKLKYGWQNI